MSTNKKEQKRREEQSRRDKAKNSGGGPPKGQNRQRRRNGEGATNSGEMSASKSSAPASFSTVTKTNGARFKTTRNYTEITHSELFHTLLGDTTFQARGFSVNPGNALLFPWLAGVAPMYQEFEFVHLKLRYVARAGTSTNGNVMLGADYDAETPLPTSEIAFAAYEGTKEVVPWKDADFTFSKDAMSALSQRKYVLSGFPTKDIKTYVPAVAILCTTDASILGLWGKVWVEYTVRLYTPQVPFSGSVASQVVGGRITAGGTLALATALGSAPVVDAQAVGMSIATYADVKWIQFPKAGSYLMVVTVTGGGLSALIVDSLPTGPLVSIVSTLIAGGSGALEQTYEVSVPHSTYSHDGIIKFAVTGTSITGLVARIAQCPALSMAFALQHGCKHCDDVRNCKKCSAKRALAAAPQPSKSSTPGLTEGSW